MLTGSTETAAWQAFALATMMRDTLRLHGGESAGDVTLPADIMTALTVGLYRLAELTREAAATSV